MPCTESTTPCVRTSTCGVTVAAIVSALNVFLLVRTFLA